MASCILSVFGSDAGELMKMSGLIRRLGPGPSLERDPSRGRKLPCDLQRELESLIAESVQKEESLRDGRRDNVAIERIVERRDHVIVADSDTEALSPNPERSTRDGRHLQARVGLIVQHGNM